MQADNPIHTPVVGSITETETQAIDYPIEVITDDSNVLEAPTYGRTQWLGGLTLASRGTYVHVSSRYAKQPYGTGCLAGMVY